MDWKNETCVKNFDRNSVNLGVNSVNYGARPQKAGIEFRAFFSFHQDARLSIFIVDVDKVEPLTIRAWRNSLLKEITHVRPTYVFRQRCFCLSFYHLWEIRKCYCLWWKSAMVYVCAGGGSPGSVMAGTTWARGSGTSRRGRSSCPPPKWSGSVFLRMVHIYRFKLNPSYEWIMEKEGGGYVL